MAVISRRQESLVDNLVEFADDPAIVEEALRTFGDSPQPPTLKELLLKILEIRHARGLGEPGARDANSSVPLIIE